MSDCLCSENNIVSALEQDDSVEFSHVEHQKCPAVGYQPLTVCVPVTVTPFAQAKSTTMYCCGDPIVRPGCETCEGKVNGNCTFTLSQRIIVAVPVDFGATTSVGAAAVQCGIATSKDLTPHCCD